MIVINIYFYFRSYDFVIMVSFGINLLPDEILRMIFVNLNNVHLENVLLVCLRWRNIGETVWICNKMIIQKSEVHWLLINRLAKIEDLSLSKQWSSDNFVEFLSVCEQLLYLKRLTLLNLNLSYVELSQMVSIFQVFESIDFGKSHLPIDYLKTTFDAIAVSRKMKVLKIDNNNLSKVDIETLASVVNKLEEIHMQNCSLTALQSKSIFAKMMEIKTMKILRIGGNILSSINENILSSAVIHLSEAHLNGCRLNTSQLNLLFEKLRKEEVKLKKLDVSFNNLSMINQESLNFSATRLLMANLSFTRLSKEQIESYFEQIIINSSLSFLSMNRSMLKNLNKSLVRQVNKQVRHFFC